MRSKEREQIEAALDALNKAFDPDALEYNQTMTIMAHRILKTIDLTPPKKREKPSE